ncbi:MAG: chromate efflux transporter [Rhodocyclaceae bacterium]|nr:chromate efflux transporter [Rhodocyclaceae bacterium]
MIDLSQKNPLPAPQSVSFWAAFRFWLKLGFVSFGGPAGQIAIMHQELVENKRWISERRFLHALNYCMVLPGPEAQQLAIYIGWLLHRGLGGVVAGTLFVLPSLVILITLSWIYLAFGHLAVVAGIFYGVKPAVTAIVFQATHRIGSRTLHNRTLWGVAITAFLALFVGDVPFPAIILAAALFGYLGGKQWPSRFATGGGHDASKKNFGPALIDDHTPPPEHARLSWVHSAKIGAVGLAFWLMPMGLLVSGFGWQGIYTQMGLFFSKAALLTFGGAYAVLPYVVQGAVEHYGWLSAGQMIDGLALGETTPGPLIMVVAFVGFVGGYLNEVLGQGAPFLSGVVGALIVTWFTFLPSFVFILLGGPIVEATHGNVKFTAPLTAISAAVVGVILNLAFFLGYHTLWANGFGGGILGGMDIMAALIAFAAFVALLKYKANVLVVIGASALTGLLLKLLVG